MSGIFKSLRIMTGQNLKKMVLEMLIAVVILNGIVVAAVLLLRGTEHEFWYVIATEFIPCFAIFVPAIGIAYMGIVYNCNSAIAPGYKYFHSIQNSDIHFRNAIIASNLLVIFFCLVGSLVFLLINQFVLRLTIHISLIFIVCFAGAGLTNFMGYMKNTIAKVLIIMPLCGFAGFIVGFTADSGEEEAVISYETMVIIALAVSAAIFVGGLVFTLIKCRKSWRADK